MTRELDDAPASEVRWWSWPPIHRAIWHIMLWCLTGIGALWFFGSLYIILFARNEFTWSNFIGSIVWPGVALFIGRFMVVAVGIENDVLLVRHVFPGWVERIPFSRIRRGWTFDDIVSMSIYFFVKHSLPIHFPFRSRGGVIFGRRESKEFVPGWEDLIAELKARITPHGEWWD